MDPDGFWIFERMLYLCSRTQIFEISLTGFVFAEELSFVLSEELRSLHFTLTIGILILSFNSLNRGSTVLDQFSGCCQ